MKVKHSVVIQRPLEEVFAFVTNLENETRWQPEILSVKLDGLLQTGTTFHEVRRTFGRTVEWHFRITHFEPPYRITIETISGTVPYRGSRLFEAVTSGTQVTEIGELQTSGIFKLIDPFLGWFSKRPLSQAYNNLKRLLENDEI